MDITSIALLFSIISGQLIKFPINLGGITLLDITIFSLTVLGAIKLKFKLKNPPIIFKLAGLFLVICLASLIFTPLKLTIMEYLTSFSYTLRLLFYFLFGWIIYSDGLKEIQKNILKILIYSGIGLSILGIIQLIIFPNLSFLTSLGWDPHYYRIVSTFLDPNFLGAYLVLTLLITIQFGQKIFSKRLQSIFFLLIYISLMGTFSRGAYLMFAVSFFMLSLLIKSIRLFGLTFILCLFLGIAFFIYTSTIAAPRNIDRTQSAEYRISSWNQGLNMFSKNPILGVGFNSYRYGLSQYNLGTDQFIISRGASTNDSSLLYVVATTGIIGLISYLSLIISLLIYGFRLMFKKNPNGVILIAGLFGLLVHSLFADSLFYPFILIWLILYLNYKSNN